jgi:type II secretory pathway pseudopilin PulG
MHTRGVSGGRERERGFTLIELLVAFSALMVVLLGLSRMLLSSQVAATTTHEATLAKEAARMQIEVLQSVAFADIWATYNSDDGDDPGVPGSAPGATFAVRGLEAPLDDADGMPGEILFPEVGGKLSELASAPQYGWPIEMDGVAGSSDDVSGSYRVLPVVVRVAWRGTGGDGAIEFRTMVGSL